MRKITKKQFALISGVVGIISYAIAGGIAYSKHQECNYIAELGQSKFSPKAYKAVKGEQVVVEKTIPADISELSIETTSPDVKISMSEGKDIVAKLSSDKYQSQADNTLGSAFELNVESHNQTAKIKVEVPEKIKWSLHNAHANLEIKIPKSYAGAIKTVVVSGDVEAEGLVTNSLNFVTTSGSLELKDIKSKNMDIYTVSGDVKIDKMSAEKMQFVSTSGDLKASALDCVVSFSGKTVSGDQEISWRALPKKIDDASTSGEIKVKIPAHSGIRYSLTSISGSISVVAKDANSLQKNKRDLEGTIGDGSNNLQINTVSGDIEIHD